jgi:two-component system, cell cycle response regulator
MSTLQTMPPPPVSRARLLVVDADPQGRERVVAALRDEGYDICTCATASNLMEQVRAAPPDLILLSAHTPGVSWAQACDELRAVDQARLVQVILMSPGPADEATVVRGLEAGAHDFVSSLDRLDELKARVRVQLRHRRDRELLQWASAQRARFRTEALMDALTGIGNRRAGEEGLAQALAMEGGFLLMMLDVDHFKHINDTHGHAAGDAVLRHVAGGLDRLARRGDVVARYGGEEFLLVLRGVRPEQAHRVAQRFRRTVAALRFEDAPGVAGITVSIGAATWSGQGSIPSAHALLEAADEALYTAKREGRNRVVVTHLQREAGDTQVA